MNPSWHLSLSLSACACMCLHTLRFHSSLMVTWIAWPEYWVSCPTACRNGKDMQPAVSGRVLPSWKHSHAVFLQAWHWQLSILYMIKTVIRPSFSNSQANSSSLLSGLCRGGRYPSHWWSNSHQPLADSRGCGHNCVSAQRVHPVSTKDTQQPQTPYIYVPSCQLRITMILTHFQTCVSDLFNRAIIFAFPFWA